MTEREILKRRIILKQQLIALLNEELDAMLGDLREFDTEPDPDIGINDLLF